MKKMPNEPDLLEEYDFRGGVRGKYAREYREGAKVMTMDPDVLPYFPDAEAVNSALRGLAAIIRAHETNHSSPD